MAKNDTNNTSVPNGAPLIYSRIVSAMAAIGNIGKDHRAQAGNSSYNFRGIDDVYNALQKPLADNGIFIAPTIMSNELRELTVNGKTVHKAVLVVRFKFYAADGSFVEADTVGEALDYSDKASNKAMSAAFKYACFQVFCIPTVELFDTESDDIRDNGKLSPQQAGQQRASQPQNAGAGQQSNAAQKPATSQASGTSATQNRTAQPPNTGTSAKVVMAKEIQIQTLRETCKELGYDEPDVALNFSDGKVKTFAELTFDQAAFAIKNVRSM